MYDPRATAPMLREMWMFFPSSDCDFKDWQMKTTIHLSYNTALNELIKTVDMVLKLYHGWK